MQQRGVEGRLEIVEAGTRSGLRCCRCRVVVMGRAERRVCQCFDCAPSPVPAVCGTLVSSHDDYQRASRAVCEASTQAGTVRRCIRSGRGSPLSCTRSEVDLLGRPPCIQQSYPTPPSIAPAPPHKPYRHTSLAVDWSSLILTEPLPLPIACRSRPRAPRIRSVPAAHCQDRSR